MRQKILDFIKTHKKITGTVLIAFIILGYYGYKTIFSTANEIRYVLAAVEKGQIVSTISGSGQVSASGQTDISTKTSGEIISVKVKEGQYVKAGTLIAQINARDALASMRDAANSYESAKIALEKFKEPIDDYSKLQAENSLAQAKETKETAENNLTKAYDDGFNTVANAFLDLPSVMTGLYDILFKNTLESSQQNIDYYMYSTRNYDDKAEQYRDETYTSYQSARIAYDKTFAAYQSSSRTSTTDAIESLITETYDTTKVMSDGIKTTTNFIQFYQDTLSKWGFNYSTVSTSNLATLNSYAGKANTHLLNLLSIKNSIQSYKDAIINAERTISEKTEYLSKITKGPDALDLRSQELTLQQRANSLSTARQKLSDYSIRAPFDGTIATLNIKKGDQASGTIATLITKQIIAEISLNEVDAAKIKVDQEATLTFDAIENLTIKGKVLSIDTIGTVSQGVVTYNVKISFDVQDESVKPGMSVSATITTASKNDTLLVPISAVKSFGNQKYVEMIDGATAPAKKSFTKKQISPDTQTATSKETSSNTTTKSTNITPPASTETTKTTATADTTKSTNITTPTPTNSPKSATTLDSTPRQFSKSTSQTEQGITSKIPPRQQPVEVGLSNDTMTEILSGLKEGDSIVVKTINPSATTTAATSQRGLFGGGGMPH